MTRACVVAILFVVACGGDASVAEPPAAPAHARLAAAPAPVLPPLVAVVEDVVTDDVDVPPEVDHDDDGEGIPDSYDRCPDVPDSNDDYDGCPDPVPAADGVLERETTGA